MTLAVLQDRFLATVTEGEGTKIVDWPPDMRDGLIVYRTAYRARLLDCLRGAFDKSRKWIGDESFDAAAAHHLILHPPVSWTLDDLGRDFSDTLAELFPNDPEVEELACLEWELQRLFTGPDAPVLAAVDFTSRASTFSEMDWFELRLNIIPNVILLQVRTDCAALWTAIDEEADIPSIILRSGDTHLLVWRQDLRSRFRIINHLEAHLFELLRRGRNFHQLCLFAVDQSGNEAGVAAVGNMLGRWINDGLVTEIRTCHELEISG